MPWNYRDTPQTSGSFGSTGRKHCDSGRTGSEISGNACKTGPFRKRNREGFRPAAKPVKNVPRRTYARVSNIADQQTLPLQIRAMREYAAKRGWTVAVQIKEVGSGRSGNLPATARMACAAAREIDVVLVWRLDRWGRSLADLVVTLKELAELGVAFVSASLPRLWTRQHQLGLRLSGLTIMFLPSLEHPSLLVNVCAPD